MVAQTFIKYGKVVINQCHTLKFDQTPVMDESGTDLLYVKTVVRVVGFIAAGNSTTVEITPNTNDGDAASSHFMARTGVLPPRREFEMVIGANINESGGSRLLLAQPAVDTSPDNPTNIDVNNGPKCTEFEITNIAQNNVLRVEAEFEICKVECNSNGGVPDNNSGVLNNRWSVLDVIDADFYTTRTYTGRLRLMHVVTNPNKFRGFIVPRLQPGMKRESMVFNVSVDGLTINYTIIDREVAFSAPEPATSWSYDYTETTGDEMQGYGQIRIRLSGDRDVNKTKLIQIAGAMLNARILSDVAANRIVEYVSITDSYGSNPNINTITASARVRHNAGPEKFRHVAHRQLGKPIDQADLGAIVANYDSRFSRGGKPGDDIKLEGPVASAGAFAVYLQDPCDGKHEIGEAPTGTESTSGPSGEEVPVRAFIYEPLPPDSEQGYLSPSHFEAAYTKYQVESTYASTRNKIQLPIAKSGIQSYSLLTSVVVSLAQGTATRTIRVDAERVGAWPLLPTPQDYIDTAAQGSFPVDLLDFIFRPGTKERTPDGKEIYRLSAEYVFAMARPHFVNEPIPVGYNPWESVPLGKTNPAMFANVELG